MQKGLGLAQASSNRAQPRAAISKTKPWRQSRRSGRCHEAKADGSCFLYPRFAHST